ncbi:hypothetical protein ACFL5C_02895 [Candidatus Omnitrophota bacterium]
MVLVMLGVIAVYLVAQTVWIEGNARINLQRQARTAMEEMVRGVDGTDGIREAASVTISGGTNIQYTSGVDGTERSFYLSGDEIMYDPDTSSGGDEFSIGENVRTTPSGLSFSESDDVVTIDLSMEDQVGDKTISVDLSGQVKLRN